MTQFKRPGPVTAVAVLCLLFGGLGLVFNLCAMGGAGVAVYALSHPTPIPPGDPDPFALGQKVNGLIPSLKFYVFIALGLTWLLCVVEVFAGLRLLKMKYSGRHLAIFYATCAILIELASLGYNVAVIQPHSDELKKEAFGFMEQFMKKAQAQNNAGGPPKNAGKGDDAKPEKAADDQNKAMAGNPALEMLSSVVGISISLLYPAIVLFIMLMPKTRRAFAIANGDATAEPEDYHDRLADSPPAVKAAPPPQDRPPPPDDEFRYVARDE